jgi:hypothetical protein
MRNKILFVLLAVLFIFSCKQTDLESLITDNKLESTADSSSPYKTVLYKGTNGKKIFAPGNLRAESLADVYNYTGSVPNGIILQWAPVVDAKKYLIFRAPDNGGNPGDFVQISEITADSYIDAIDIASIGEGSKRFHYQIKSVNAAGTVSEFSKNAIGEITLGSFSGIVQSLNASRGTATYDGKSSVIKLSWDRVEGAAWYSIYRKVVVDGEDNEISQAEVVIDKFIPLDLTESLCSFLDNYSENATKDGVLYKYWVVPYNEYGVVGGGTRDTGDNSAIGYTLPMPINTKVSKGLYGGGIRVSWQFTKPDFITTDPTGFYVYRSSQRNAGFEVITNTDGTAKLFSYSAGDMLDANTWYMVDDFGDTDHSDGISLPLDPKYFYRVSVVIGSDPAVESRLGTAVSGFAVHPDAIGVPSGFSVASSKATTDNSSDRILISWPEISGASFYNLCRGSSEDGSFKELGFIRAEDMLSGNIFKAEFINSIKDSEGNIISGLTDENGDPYNPDTSQFGPYNEDGILVIPNLAYGKTYYFRIQPIGSNNYPGPMSEADFGFTMKAPVNVSGEILNSGFVSLEWEAPENATKLSYYKVYRKESSVDSYSLISGSIYNNTFDDKSAESGKSYDYAVRSFSEDGSYSRNSISINVVTLEKPVINSVELYAADSDIDVSWNPLSSSDFVKINKFKVYRFLKGDDLVPNASALIYSSDDSSVVEYIDNSAELERGVRYSYCVSALCSVDFDKDGVFDAELETNLSDPSDGSLIGVPGFVSPTAGSFADKIVVIYDRVEGSSDYSIQIVPVGDAAAVSIINPSDPANNSREISPVPPESEYEISVAAINSAGEIGPYSSAVNGRTRKSDDIVPPENLSVSEGLYCESIYLNWDRQDSFNGVDVISYNVYRSDNPDAVLYTVQNIADSSDPIGKEVCYDVVPVELRSSELFYSISSILTDGSESVKSPWIKGSTIPAPASVSASKGTFSTSISLTWEKVSSIGAAGYNIYKRDDNGDWVEIHSIADSNVTNWSYVPSDIMSEAGSDLAFTVGVYDTRSPIGENKNLEGDFGYILPPALSMSVNDKVSFDKINLVWDAVPKANGYKVWRTDNPAPTGSANWVEVSAPIIAGAGDDEGKYFLEETYSSDPESIEPFVLYYYKVQAYSDLDGGYLNFESTADSVSQYIANAPDIEVSGFGTVVPGSLNDNGTQGVVSWSMPKLPDSYSDFSIKLTLTRLAGSGEPIEVVISDRAVTDKTFTDLLPGTPCRVTALAILEGVESGNNITNSNIKDFTPVFNSPVIKNIVEGDIGTSTTIQFSWDNLDSSLNPIDSYIIARSTTYNGNYEDVRTVSGVTFGESGYGQMINSPGTYFYKLYALNGDGCKSNASEIKAIYNIPAAIASGKTTVRDDVLRSPGFDESNLTFDTSNMLDSKIKLQWAHVAGVNYYKVYYYKENNPNSKILLDGIVSPPATGSIIDYVIEDSFAQSGGGSEAIAPGLYYFWVQPWVSAAASGYSSKSDSSGPFHSYSLKGARDINNDEWIYEVNKEAYNCINLLGGLESYHWSYQWASGGWIPLDPPDNLPTSGNYRNGPFIQSANGNVGRIWGERLLWVRTWIDNSDANFRADRWAFRDISTGYLILNGQRWVDWAGISDLMGTLTVFGIYPGALDYNLIKVFWSDRDKAGGSMPREGSYKIKRDSAADFTNVEHENTLHYGFAASQYK